jgi:hypothetical protein
MTPLTIAQISDLHCGSPHFVPDLLDRASRRAPTSTACSASG